MKKSTQYTLVCQTNENGWRKQEKQKKLTDRDKHQEVQKQANLEDSVKGRKGEKKKKKKEEKKTIKKRKKNKK